MDRTYVWPLPASFTFSEYFFVCSDMPVDSGLSVRMTTVSQIVDATSRPSCCDRKIAFSITVTSFLSFCDFMKATSFACTSPSSSGFRVFRLGGPSAWRPLPLPASTSLRPPSSRASRWPCPPASTVMGKAGSAPRGSGMAFRLRKDTDRPRLAWSAKRDDAR